MKLLSSLVAPATLKIIAAPLAILLSGLCFLGASSAAFTGWTGNSNNTWTAGTVGLIDNHASVLFAPADIAPGYTESHCITVTSTASVQTFLQFYAVHSNDQGLGNYLTLDIEAGSGGTDGVSSCTGFVPSESLYSGTLSSLGATHSTVGTALNVAAPLAAGGSQQFKITAVLPANTPNAAQGTSATMDFNWVNHS